MKRLPQIALLPDGKRLHLQDGPIDLVIEAKGRDADIRAAYDAAVRRFNGLLDELCAELIELRQPADPFRCTLKSAVARRMHAAVAPFAADHFITPMAAVAGSVAQEILGAMLGAARLERAYVNNGGDIALHLAPGQSLEAGVFTDPAHGFSGLPVDARFTVEASSPVRGIATSGWRGRSFSLGIADAATVLAATASCADAAATVLGNAVDLDDPRIVRRPASAVRDDSDLGERLVVRAVPTLPAPRVDQALARGAAEARAHVDAGRIVGAVLSLQGRWRVVGDIGADPGGELDVAVPALTSRLRDELAAVC